MGATEIRWDSCVLTHGVDAQVIGSSGINVQLGPVESMPGTWMRRSVVYSLSTPNCKHGLVTFDLDRGNPRHFLVVPWTIERVNRVSVTPSVFDFGVMRASDRRRAIVVIRPVGTERTIRNARIVDEGNRVFVEAERLRGDWIAIARPDSAANGSLNDAKVRLEIIFDDGTVASQSVGVRGYVIGDQ